MEILHVNMHAAGMKIHIVKRTKNRLATLIGVEIVELLEGGKNVI